MTIQRGEIYFVNLNHVQGREQAGQRPVLILSINSINKLPLVVTVIVGTKGENITRDFPTNVRVSSSEGGLSMETVFYVFKSVPWIRIGFSILQRDKFLKLKWQKLKHQFVIV